VHPSNRPSIEFSRNAFPEANEAQPPEDHPHASFALALHHHSAGVRPCLADVLDGSNGVTEVGEPFIGVLTNEPNAPRHGVGA
jgi:hypothetical protein